MAAEYDTEIMQLISDYFEVICRIPVMRSKPEFKAFFDLEIIESTAPISRDNSLDRASIGGSGGPFASFAEQRATHTRNNTIKYSKSNTLVASQPVHDYM